MPTCTARCSATEADVFGRGGSPGVQKAPLYSGEAKAPSSIVALRCGCGSTPPKASLRFAKHDGPAVEFPLPKAAAQAAHHAHLLAPG